MRRPLPDGDGASHSIPDSQERAVSVSFRLFVAVGLWLASMGPAWPQVRGTLQLAETIPTPSAEVGVFLLPAKCDRSGNLYFRTYRMGDVSGAPVVRLSPDGRRVVKFDFRSVPELNKERPYIRDFEIAARGDVYLLGNSKDDRPLLLQFRDDGKYDSTIRIGADILTARLVLAGANTFLISGFDRRDPKDRMKPFLGIFDTRGRFLSQLSLAGDPLTEGSAKAAEEREAAISMGSIVSGGDGAAYLMRPGAHPRVFVLSAGGDLIKSYDVRPPEEGFEADPMFVSGARLLVPFHKEKSAKRPIFAVLDAATGERLVDYALPDNMSGALACFDQNTLTFITGRRGSPGLLIQRAVMR
jgi:hypothetical protein